MLRGGAMSLVLVQGWVVAAAKEAVRAKNKLDQQSKDHQKGSHDGHHRNATAKEAVSDVSLAWKWLELLKEQVPALLTPELRDLAVGTAVVGFIIACCFLRQSHVSNRRHTKAMNRSLSCPALVELNSKTALDACAEMMAAFDDRRRNPRTRVPHVPSMPTLIEVEPRLEAGSNRGSRRTSSESMMDELILSDESRNPSVSSSPRGLSPRTSPRASPRASPRSTSPRRSDCARRRRARPVPAQRRC